MKFESRIVPFSVKNIPAPICAVFPLNSQFVKLMLLQYMDPPIDSTLLFTKLMFLQVMLSANIAPPYSSLNPLIKFRFNMVTFFPKI